MQGLVTLLYGYIPALFIIGSQVRDCHWSAQGEQHAAGPLLSRCLHVLLRLTLGYEDKVEYVRTIVVARLLWSQWFARLPGVAHSEEPCEALLSRVVHLMAQHPGNCTLQQVHDLFILTPVADQTPKDLQYVNVPKGLPQLVDRRFTRLMARFDVGVIPPLVWSSQKSSIVQDRWDPAKMDFPCALDTVLTAEHYRDLCAKTLQTLVKPVKVDALVKIQLTKIKFDTDLTRGQTRERDEDSVLSRIASLRTNPPCRPISNILIWRNEGTLPSCHTPVVIFTQSGRLGTAVPISLISPISHLPVVHFSIS